MKICKVPILRLKLKALNKHNISNNTNITNVMYMFYTNF